MATFLESGEEVVNSLKPIDTKKIASWKQKNSRLFDVLAIST